LISFLVLMMMAFFIKKKGCKKLLTTFFSQYYLRDLLNKGHFPDIRKSFCSNLIE
jgi:hypothetical protein